eukprot:gene26371-29793_t
MDLTPIDLYLLSDSSNCQIVVKTDVLRDVGNEASQNVMDLYTVHQQDPSRNLFQLAGTGSTTKGLKDSKFRGDYRCWVSVRLCEEFHMFGVKLLISKIVALCQSKLKVEHGLNGHYSIQAALYHGDGAHYVRHLDAGTGNAVLKNRSDFEKSYFQKGTKDTLSNDADAALPGKRRLTFIYYLNEQPSETGVDVG